MSALAVHKYNPQCRQLPETGREDDFLKRVSPSCLLSYNARGSFLFSKHIRKPNPDSISLMAFGSFKFVKLKLPYFEHSVSAGYPTSVDDPFTRHLDLSRYLIRHPKSTYYFKVSGYSMTNAGINDKDLLVVDTALRPKHRDIIIAVLNGELMLKRLYLEDAQIKLLSANPAYPPITVTKEMAIFCSRSRDHCYSYF